MSGPEDNGKRGGDKPAGAAKAAGVAKARLDLVDAANAADAVERRQQDIDAATALVRAASATGDLGQLDHEALLALTLGEGVARIDEDEQHAAEQLRLALDGLLPGEPVAQHRNAPHGNALHDDALPLLQLAESLRHVWQAGEAIRLAETLPETQLDSHGAARSGARWTALPAADHEAILGLTLGADIARFGSDEQAEAQALARALDRGERHLGLAQLADSLGALHRCVADDAAADLDPLAQDSLLAVSLGIASAPAEAEAQAAAQLAQALDDPSHAVDVPLAALATSLRHAHTPSDIDELSRERLLRAALKTPIANTDDATDRRDSSDRVTAAADGDSTVVNLAARRRTRTTAFTAFVAVAAAVALFVGSWNWLETQAGGGVARPQADVPPTLAQSGATFALSRSTSELFDPMTPFASKGGESSRMAKIVAARNADLRANRFAAWGVR